MRSMSLTAQLLAGMALLSSAGGTAASQAPTAAGAKTESAIWTARELTFVYQGLTAKYSCAGVRDTMQRVLLALGARGDLEVRESGCSSPGGPDPFPGVRVKMYVLQPFAGGASPGAAAPVAAHWQTVELAADRNPIMASSQCELFEQIEHFVLPLFATRNVAASFSCVPNQVQLGSARVRAEVLMTDESAAAPAAAQSRPQ